MNLLNIAARIRVSGDVAGLIMVIAIPIIAIAVLHSILDFIISKIILRKLTEAERKKHILSKLLYWLTLILVLGFIALFVAEMLGMSSVISDFFNSIL